MILSGQNFAKIADYKYAETIASENKEAKSVIYPLNTNILEDGDVIYCKTDYIYNLFSIVKKIKVKIKIITSQSDYEISKQIFQRKPDCVEKWYAINVNYEHEDLVPIPLGIANDYCKITAKFEDIEEPEEKQKLLYVNHRNSTNPEERKYLYEIFKNNEWCSVDYPNLTIEQFKKKARQHQYMICPRGNGIDTHRLWECLYMGLFPIVKKHITHKNLKDLPILFVDSFRQINEDFLLENLNLMKNKNKDLLYVENWRKKINNNE